MKDASKFEVTVGQFIAGGVSMGHVSGGDSKGRKLKAVLALFEAAGWAMGGDCLTGYLNQFSERVCDERVSLLMALRAVGLKGLDGVRAMDLNWRQKAGAQWLACGELDMPVWAVGQDLDELEDLGLGGTVAGLAEWLGLGGVLLPEQLGEGFERQKAIASVRELGWN